MTTVHNPRTVAMSRTRRRGVPLVEITPQQHGVDLDLVYASPNNLTGKPIYAQSYCYLHADTEQHLLRAVELAAAIGCRLKILDAFRPAEAQWVLWHHLPDPTYIADPRIGSSHSMGAAIDLTLVDTTSNEELAMGTGFDDMRPLSMARQYRDPVRGATEPSSPTRHHVDSRFRLLSQ
jgi:D-alanyl-D-alanine dipeptidase